MFLCGDFSLYLSFLLCGEQLMTSITSTYEGDLRCRAEHGPSGAILFTDAPLDNQGKGESFSPTDLMAASLGSCMMTIMGIFAQRHGIVLNGMTATTTKGMSADLPRRIVSLRTTLSVPIAENHPSRKALEHAALDCPVHHSLSADIDAAIEFKWIGS